MSNLKIFNYQGNPVQFDEVNGQIMANATLMAKVFGKRPIDWMKLESTKKYISAIVRKNHISENQLVITKEGSPENGGGTWIHEKLIIDMARWLNVDFAVWCDEKIAELLRTGKTELKPMTPAEMLLQQCQMLVDQEKRIFTVENDIKEIKARQTTHPENYYAVSGYASKCGINVDHLTAKKIGKKAASLCRELGYVTGSVPDPKYGSVKTYPQDLLKEIFSEMFG